MTGSAKEGWSTRRESSAVSGSNKSGTHSSFTSNKDAKIPSYASVSDEYLLNLASNSGINVKRFMNAQDALTDARRTFNNARSGQEKSQTQRQLKDAEKEYEKLRQQLINQINEKR